jgi:hypothetical protein
VNKQIQELLTILKWTSIAATASAIFFTIVKTIQGDMPKEALDIVFTFVFLFLMWFAAYIFVVLFTRAYPRRELRKKKSE